MGLHRHTGRKEITPSKVHRDQMSKHAAAIKAGETFKLQPFRRWKMMTDESELRAAISTNYTLPEESCAIAQLSLRETSNGVRKLPELRVKRSWPFANPTKVAQSVLHVKRHGFWQLAAAAAACFDRSRFLQTSARKKCTRSKVVNQSSRGKGETRFVPNAAAGRRMFCLAHVNFHLIIDELCFRHIWRCLTV